MRSEEQTAGTAPVREEQASRRARVLAFVLLLAALASHWLPRLSGPIDLHYDGATYYVLAQALAEGKGYRLLNEPGEIEALQYPPLFPLWIAAHMRLAGSAEPASVAPLLRVSQALLSLALAGALFALARRFLPLWPALFAALLTTLSFRTVYLSDLLFPELLFTLLSVLFFLASSARRTGWHWLAGPLAAAAFLTRTIGVALLAAWVAEALFARRWRNACARALLALVPVAAWQGYGARVESSADYREPAYAYQRAPYLYNNVSYGRNLFLIDPFAPERGFIGLGGLAHRCADNARHLPTFIGELVLAPVAEFAWPLSLAAQALGVEFDPKALLLTLLACAGLVTLAGLAWFARSQERGPPLYVLLSLLAIVVTPWQHQFWRYLAPLTPFFALGFAYLLARAARAAEARGARALRVAVLLLALFALAAQVKTTRSMFARSWSEFEWHDEQGTALRGHAFYVEEEWRTLEQAFAWLRAHAAAGEVVASTVPQLAWLGTGLPSVWPPFDPDPAAALAALDTVPVRYVIVDQLSFLDVTQRYARALVEAQPESFELLYRASGESSLSIWRRR
ncbi:MAG: hypothetical protein ABL998_08825 [Planctomycetota bacterium]